MKYDQKNLKYHITIVLLTVLCILFGYLYVGSSIKSNDLRGQVSSVREQLDRETETNRQLRTELESSQSRLEQCHFILEEFRETTNRDISTIRDAIEIIEETREAVGAMEMSLGMFDSDRYYDWLDNYILSNEEIDERD